MLAKTATIPVEETLGHAVIEAAKGMDKAGDRATSLVCQLNLLTRTLERELDIDRGTPRGQFVHIAFSADNLDAIHWLVGEAWTKAKDLENDIAIISDRLDEAAVTVEASA